jgi:protoheme IX farnesyltransferase
MGWTAAGGEILALEPALLGATLFLWQFPHFFALAWVHRKDYTRGGHQMVPVNDPSGERTAALIFNYSLAMLPLPIIAAVTDVTSWMYALEGCAMTSYAVYLAGAFKEERSNENARRVFKCSLWYLPLSLALFVFHRKYAEVDAEKRHDDASAQISFLEEVKAFGKSMCVHEALVTTQTGGGQKALCPNTSSVAKTPPSPGTQIK